MCDEYASTTSDPAAKQLEYKAAQYMLCHYDSLNWRIGSILIAATLVLTGLLFQKQVIDLIQTNANAPLIVVFAVPSLSFSVLLIWFLWLRRHRALYNFRNETLQRLELQLGMYHYLLVAEAELKQNLCKSGGCENNLLNILNRARKNAGHDAESFTPFFPNLRLPKPSGYQLAFILMLLIPIAQLAILLAVRLA
jgi:hypothetical protein